MLDIGWSELLVIGIVALVVIGPKELPGVLRTVGQMVGKLRRMAGEFQGQFQEALREAELDGLKKEFTDFKDEANRSISGALPSNPLLDLENEVKAAKDAIEGRKDEPATKVDDATAVATGIDPVTAAVEAQLPPPEEPLPLFPNAFEELAPAVARAETKPVEVKPLETKPAAVVTEAAAKPVPAQSAAAKVETAKPDQATSEPAKPKRKPSPNPKPVAKPADAEPEIAEAVADLDGPGAAPAAEKPRRKPRVKAVKPASDEEGPAS